MPRGFARSPRKVVAVCAALALGVAPGAVAAQRAVPVGSVAPAPPSIADRVVARLAEAGQGVRFGLVVLDETGSELIAINPEGRFVPGSNTKIATTAAAAMLLSESPAAPGEGTRVRLSAGRAPDVVLEGRGDPWLSAATGCVRDCLAALADAVAARTRRVRDVIGDATWFADQRWPAGMSWNNIPTRSGTAIAALSVDDNELAYAVRPGAAGQAPTVAGPEYLTIDNRAVTLPAGTAPTPERALALHRAPMARTAVLTGEISADALPVVLRQGVDDPAHYAAWALARMLALRGVRVGGEVRSRYREPGAGPPTEPAEPPLARLEPPPLAEAVARINKDSQNHHAEVLLRRIGRAGGGDGTAEDGQRAVAALYAAAGVGPEAFAFADGSGMSTYNRMTPRGTARLVQWIARQPWGGAWEASLPVAGRDGTLANRFRGSPLEGRLIAKTGSLNATNALSGWLVTRSGRRLAFAMFANDVPQGVSAIAAMDAALAILAEY